MADKALGTPVSLETAGFGRVCLASLRTRQRLPYFSPKTGQVTLDGCLAAIAIHAALAGQSQLPRTSLPQTIYNSSQSDKVTLSLSWLIRQ
jgi:hypothetical protein